MKIRKARRRPVLGIILLVFICSIFLARPPYPIIPTPRIPPDFSSTAPYAPPSSLPPPFTVPQIIAAYCRHDCAIISLFTSGIAMSVSERNLSAVACRIGNYVVPALSFEHDVLHCPGDRLRPGHVLAPVLLRDEALRNALQGPVTLNTGVVAELHETNLLPLRGLTVHQSLDRNLLALVPSDYKYQPSPPAPTWRWQVCLMTQIKPATYLLPDWVDYHRRIGVDRVFIFDNGASENISELFPGRNDVEVIRWPYHKVQLQLVGFFLLASRNICEYVLHMDADEFYMFGLGSRGDFMDEPPLPRYLRLVKQNGFHRFRLPYITMANSGYRLRPLGPVPENFLHRDEDQFFNNGKAVCETDLDYDSGLVHSCGTVGGQMVGFYTRRPVNWGEINMAPTKLEDPAFVVHYRERSWEEWIERMNAGWVVGRLVIDRFKDVLDIDDPDESFMAFNDSLRYTHFRDVFRRVTKDGRLDRAYLVRHDPEGKRNRRSAQRKRCVREINMVTGSLPPGVETCWDV